MSPKKKILIVEDNSETQLIIKVILRDFYDVEITDNADSAIDLIKTKNFDLVLLDINLKGEKNGKDVLNKVRNDLNLTELPVIVITAYDFPGDEKKYLISLSCDYLEKPLDKNVLLNSIGGCLRNK